MPYVMLFLAVPLIEIALFVVLGGALGLWLTLAVVLGSAALGVFVLRRATQPRRPGSGGLAREVAGRGFSMLAGILLIAPGFLTSAVGLLLLLPPVQAVMVHLLGQRLGAMGFVFRQGAARPDDRRDDIIDGDFEEVSQPIDQRLPPSKWTQG